MNFGYPAQVESLRGFWMFNSIGSEGIFTDVVELSLQQAPSSNGNGLMASANKLFGCEHQIRGSLAGNVLCVKINSSGTLLRAYLMTYSVNDGEGYSVTGSSSNQQMLLVRRITAPRGAGTGLIWKNDEDHAIYPGALMEAIDRIATYGLQH
jgi:hypothetical protein